MREPRPSFDEFGLAFGCSVQAIQTALSRFAITRAARNGSSSARAPLLRRNCMSCEQPFLAEHKHNHRCRKCNNSNEIAA